MNTLILNASNAFREFPSGAVVKNLPANTGDARDLSSIPRLGISPGVGNGCSVQFSSVQLLSRVWFFAAPCTAAHQASLSITNSWSLFKLMSIESLMPSHPLLSLSPPAFNLSQHQGLCKGVSSSHQMAKYWSFSFSFSISPSNDYSGSILFYDWLVWFPCCLRHSQGSSPAQRLKSINYLVLSLLYGPILTSIHIESSKSLLPLYTNTQEQFLNVYVTSFPMKR